MRKEESERTGGSIHCTHHCYTWHNLTDSEREAFKRSILGRRKSEFITEPGTLYPSLLGCSGPHPGPAAGDGSASPRVVSSITVHHGGAAADLDGIVDDIRLGSVLHVNLSPFSAARHDDEFLNTQHSKDLQFDTSYESKQDVLWHPIRPCLSMSKCSVTDTLPSSRKQHYAL